LAVFKIVYDVEGVNDVKAAEKAVDDLNDANDKATKSTKELGDESDDTSKQIEDFSDKAKDAANQVNIFGVGLGDAAKGLGNMTKNAGTLTKALKAIPLLAVASALASVATFLSSTQRGQERLRVESARTSAVLATFRDRVSGVGEELANTNQNFTGWVVNVLGSLPAFRQLATELNIVQEVAGELEKQFIENEKAQIELNVARAEANAEIERQKLLAEDLSQSFDVREEAAREALRLETELLTKETELARERVETLTRQQELGENTLEDVKELAEARIELAGIEQTSLTRQIELNNKLNTIQQQRFQQEVQVAEFRVEARESEFDGIDEETEKQLEADLAIADQRRQLFIEEEARRIESEKLQDAARLRRIESEREAANEILAITTGFLAANSDIAKGLAIFNSILNTREAITKALASVPAPTSFVLAGLVAAKGFAEVASIASQQRPNVQPPKFKDGVIDLEGPGTATSDSIPAYLSRGESVMTAQETRDFLPTLKAIRKGDIDPALLNGMVNEGPTVIDASKTIEIPRDTITFDEDGFTAKIARGVSSTIVKGNRFKW